MRLTLDWDTEGAPTVRDYCPACFFVGDRTERVGTYKCTSRGCRVHFYQGDFK